MAKYAKNTSGATKTWVGQEIANNAYYLIQVNEEHLWANDSTVLTDIGAADLTIAKDNSGSNDITDVADAINWLKDNTEPKDTDGAPLSRTKITQSGWHFQMHGSEFTTSKLASGYNKDIDGNDLGYLTVKYYNSSGTELTAGTQTELDNNCVETIMEWEPGHDIDIIGGTLEQSSTPSTDVRMWVLAVPDVAANLGGSIPFAEGGINLRHISGHIDIDGKTAKNMVYNATYHTTKFRVVVKHGTGVQHSIHMIWKIFKEIGS